MMDHYFTTPDPTPAALLHTHPALHDDAQKGLMLDGVALSNIAHHAGTPCWVLSAGVLRERAAQFRAAFDAQHLPVRYHFAVKAQDHLAALTLLHQCGFGADVVSGGELHRARRAGIAGNDIVFSGIGKTDAELRLAIAEGIAQINVESAEELHRLNALAEQAGRRVRAALRVNPDVDAGTHDKITTGRADDKFGILHNSIPALYRHAQQHLKGVHLVGLAVHLGSQMMDDGPYRIGYQRLATLVRALRADGLDVEEIDCGGGLGIAYRDETPTFPTMLASVIAETLGALDVKLRVEPGRWLAGPAGVLLAEVVETKAGHPPFVILNTGMNELMRPALYGAWHGILPLASSSGNKQLEAVDVVGPICESSDVFARQRPLPPLKRGDHVALLDTGAYGAVMSSTYNTRPLAAQVMVDRGRWTIIRPRQTLEALLGPEQVPDWLHDPG